jgi:hypothetical protein
MEQREHVCEYPMNLKEKRDGWIKAEGVQMGGNNVYGPINVKAHHQLLPLSNS